MNAVLKTLFDLDQADHEIPRLAGTAEYDQMRVRDSDRQRRVRSILCDEESLNPLDQYHAAWILNHSDDSTDAELAYRLAEQSLNAGHEPSKWLFAAAFDRWCI